MKTKRLSALQKSHFKTPLKLNTHVGFCSICHVGLKMYIWHELHLIHLYGYNNVYE